MGTKRQKKKTQKFEDKLQKWKDLKACKLQDFFVSLEGSAWLLTCPVCAQLAHRLALVRVAAARRQNRSLEATSA